MITITFKDVGQGDSIIIEWENEGKNKIAIIDCKKAYGKNPVLEYIKTKGTKEIAFLLLSHPHLDHFSGFTELIEHCIRDNIIIKYFLHTSNDMPSYWKSAVDGYEANTEILRLFNIIREADIKIGMKRHSIQAEQIFSDITLNNEYSIKIIAPTSQHLDNFARNSSL
jgi:competence protein ComEC